MYYIEFALNFLIKFCMKKNIITGLVLLVWGSVFIRVRVRRLFRPILILFLYHSMLKNLIG